jgi:antitoxin component of MazEF toxin-antitoxin module
MVRTVRIILTVRRLNVNEICHDMGNNESSYRFIRNVWGEGSGSLCFSIPSEIVKKMNVTSDSFLYVELVNDTTFGVRKINHKLSKNEIEKIQKIDPETTDEKQQLESKTIIQEKRDDDGDDNSYNPLDDVF